MTARISLPELLSKSDWLQTLALELTGDVHDAQDLVQETWLQALRRPPGAEGSITGWLRAVLLNGLRQGRRRDAARIGREVRYGSSGRDLEAAADDVVARAEAQRVLAEHVLALEEPLRAVLLLRYFDGLDTAAIAELLGIGAGTVRDRHRRGVATLRARVRAEHGEDAERWLAALVPFARRTGPPEGATASAASVAPRPWLAVASLAGCASLVVVLAASGGGSEPVASRSGDAALASAPVGVLDALGAEAARVTRTSVSPDDPVAVVVLGGVDPTTRGAERSGAPVDGPRELVVRVRVDGEPASAGEVYAVRAGRVPADPAGIPVERRARLDEAGEVRFSLPADDSGWAHAVGVRLPNGAVLQRMLDGPRVEVVELELGTARIEGQVYDADGAPLAGVEVSLGIREGWDFGALGGFARSDRAGRVAFDGLPASQFWLHAELPGRGEALSHGTLALGEVRFVSFGSPSAAVRWNGVVRTAIGGPRDSAEGDQVEFARRAGDGRQVVLAALAADGSFEVELPPGLYQARLRVAGSPRELEPAGGGGRAVSVTSDLDLDLVLPGGRVEGSAVVRGRARPFDPEVDGFAALRLEREDGSLAFAARVEAGGVFRFEGVAPGTYALTGERLAEDGPIRVVVTDGRPLELDVLVHGDDER